MLLVPLNVVITERQTANLLVIRPINLFCLHELL